jgi:hypothetical protein
MYGGVITPLALVHQQIRQQNHQQQMGDPLVQLRPVGRSNSGGIWQPGLCSTILFIWRDFIRFLKKLSPHL